MKPLFAAFALMFSVSATAQTADAIYQRACGPQNTWFNVELDRTKHTSATPEPGKALVYIVQDTLAGAIDTRIGLDGAWVGTVENNSYYFVSVVPGEHHLCANHQTHALTRSLTGTAEMELTELAHFTAEAGKVYYFRARYFPAQYPALQFGPVDRDQAEHMIASYPQSTSTPKP